MAGYTRQAFSGKSAYRQPYGEECRYDDQQLDRFAQLPGKTIIKAERIKKQERYRSCFFMYLDHHCKISISSSIKAACAGLIFILASAAPNHPPLSTSGTEIHLPDL